MRRFNLDKEYLTNNELVFEKTAIVSRLYRKDDLVYKISPIGMLDNDWMGKFITINRYIDFNAFVGFVEDDYGCRGYVTRFIDGIDLQMDKPFKHRHDVVRSLSLSRDIRADVLHIFADILKAAKFTGLLFGDFTKRNIIVSDNIPHLVDFDVIIDIKKRIPNDYIVLYQKMLDYLGLEYTFDGNVANLEEFLLKNNRRSN